MIPVKYTKYKDIFISFCIKISLYKTINLTIKVNIDLL